MALLIGICVGLYLVAGEGYIVFSWPTVFIVWASAWVADLVLRPLFAGAWVGIMGSVGWVATRLGGHAEPVDPIDPVSGLHKSVMDALKMASEEAGARVKANKDVGKLE